MDAIEQMKVAAREGWSSFAPFEAITGTVAPKLLARAKENRELAELKVEFREGDVEALPFADASFDVVLSQFGHMFGPRPDVAIGEMLRVLMPGGTIAFSTWPPELFTGQLFMLLGRYAPPPPEGVPSPIAWGEPSVIRERLVAAMADRPQELAALRGELDALIATYFDDNIVRQDFLITRAIKT